MSRHRKGQKNMMKWSVVWFERGTNSVACIGEEEQVEAENAEAALQDVLHYAHASGINLKKYEPKLICDLDLEAEQPDTNS